MFAVRKFPAVLVMAGLLCAMAGAVSADTVYEGGYVPSPVDRSHLKGNPPKKSGEFALWEIPSSLQAMTSGT